MRDEADVVVVGSGPAGWAAADHCARNGLDTILVAPDPARAWTPTYGLWTAQASPLPPGAALVEPTALRASGRLLDRGYAVLDNAAAAAAYAATPVRAMAGRAVAVGGTAVALRTGRLLRCRLVLDARGPLRHPGDRIEQTAYGMVFPQEAAAPLHRPGEAVFMRWDRRRSGWPTFLYAVPLPGGRTLLEETSLARRPGLPLPELKRRLTARLETAGVDPGDRLGAELVRFAMDAPPVEERDGAVPFGVAAGMMHPATGYSVGEALETAPLLAAAVAEALPRGTRAAREAARTQVWSAEARRAHRLRAWGQRTLLRLPPPLVPEFFDAFFALPEHRQDAFLRGRGDPQGTWKAMAAVFGSAPPRLRRAMAAAGLGAVAARPREART
ncbi:FAD-dependent oxidoreductase [Glycomyces sp. A-F 0318]|uniref:lycopene cyclase family protein n=1 Tax=Glycomyces amatae TaxID=2881355 RepID=UPI001E3D64B7|nr:lycopene cyclase family protein [Glycomyces amatae]MCD0443169.1 FAD-dependent oxidoreductase [Glycomyces amatae]